MMRQRRKHKKCKGAILCNTLGIMLLLVTIIICVPLTVPKVFGFQIYTVTTGSMDPAIPVGSMVYVKYIEPDLVKEGDVIVFYGQGEESSLITHRVVSNSPVMGEFITKGDANDQNDRAPVLYMNYVGKVVKSVPKMGGLAQTITTGYGKIFLFCIIGLAAILEYIGKCL